MDINPKPVENALIPLQGPEQELSNTPEVVLDKRGRPVGWLPQTDGACLFASNNVVPYLASIENPPFFRWTTIAEIQEVHTGYQGHFRVRVDENAGRSEEIGLLKELKKEIKNIIKYPVKAMEQTFGEEGAKKYYKSAGFSINKNGHKYFSTASKTIVANLERLTDFMAEHDLGRMRYSMEHWLELLEKIRPLVNQRVSGDSKSSSTVNEKNEQKAFLQDVFRSILHFIDAQYVRNGNPDNIKRAWGFHREKY